MPHIALNRPVVFCFALGGEAIWRFPMEFPGNCCNTTKKKARAYHRSVCCKKTCGLFEVTDSLLLVRCGNRLAHRPTPPTEPDLTERLLLSPSTFPYSNTTSYPQHKTQKQACLRKRPPRSRIFQNQNPNGNPTFLAQTRHPCTHFDRRPWIGQKASKGPIYIPFLHAHTSSFPWPVPSPSSLTFPFPRALCLFSRSSASALVHPAYLPLSPIHPTSTPHLQGGSRPAPNLSASP